MRKIILVPLLISIHFSICMAQLTCKITFDRESSNLKATICNLFEDKSVLLKSNNTTKKGLEAIESFSGTKILSKIDGNKIIRMTLLFYDHIENVQRNVDVHISDRKLQENAIAPLDSVSFLIFCLDPVELDLLHKIKISVSIPFSTVDGTIPEGLYDLNKDIYL